MYAVVAELADALDLGSSGRPWGFKSSLPHHEKLNFNQIQLFCCYLKLLTSIDITALYLLFIIQI